MPQTTDTSPLPARIRLQAIDLARNIARDYVIEASPDLFGHIIVALHWGRIGTKGQSRLLSFAKQYDAARFVRQTLSRRATAKKRIGVPYRPIR
jgi:predicted DNA-binding WGR domain protein